MILKSKFLNREIEVKTYETEEYGRKMNIVTHDSLKDVYMNQLDDMALKANYQIFSSDPTHSVVRCQIVDKNGRCSDEIGETVPATLTTEIARNYPTLIAFQRAFDRAIISYLNFEGKTMSNLEVSAEEAEEAVKESKSENAQNAKISEENSENARNSFGEEVLAEDETVIAANAIGGYVEEPENGASDNISEKGSEEVKEENKENPLDYVIQWGKFKSRPIKVKDVIATDIHWVKWVLTLDLADPAQQKMQDSLREGMKILGK